MTPRLIVEVRGGRSGGTKAVIGPGQTMRFGRTDIADVVVPNDEMLSGVHFELAWDGARCTLRDRRSHEGTTLNGAPVVKAAVPHGGWIRAGRTDFMVYVEGGPPAPRGDVGEDEGDEADDREEVYLGTAPASVQHAAGGVPERRAASGQALIALRAEAAKVPLYAILDAARDERILAILRESVERHQSLYDGVDGEALDDVAPYLAGPMRADSMLLDRLVLEGWGARWGIYVASRAPFKEVRRHFRRFLMVESASTGEKLYFRFYDPRALDEVLPACGARQVNEILAETTALWLEGPEGAPVPRRIAPQAIGGEP